MLQVTLTPEQLEQKRQQLAQQYGIDLAGYTGIANYKGVQVRYVYAMGQLTLQVIAKPFLITVAMCEAMMRKFLGC